MSLELIIVGLMAVAGATYFIIFYDESKRYMKLSIAIFIISNVIAISLLFKNNSIEEILVVFRPLIIIIFIMSVPIIFSKIDRKKVKK